MRVAPPRIGGLVSRVGGLLSRWPLLREYVSNTGFRCVLDDGFEEPKRFSSRREERELKVLLMIEGKSRIKAS